MDDDEAVRLMLGEMLNHMGYSVELTEDGEAAIRAYERALAGGERFDVVLLDLTVPGGMGGKQAVERLLEIDPGARTIVLSGYSNDPVLADHARHRFSAALKKPTSMAKLREALRRVIEAT